MVGLFLQSELRVNRKFRHTILFSLMGGLVLSASAWAAWDHDGMFKRMDTNSDGRISASEHAAGAQAMFTRMDANQDGMISAAEMASGHEDGKTGERMKHHGMHGNPMAMMDTNHDGVLTEAESVAFAHTMFARMDANHDGKVTGDEMKTAHEKMEGDHDAGMGTGKDGHDHDEMADMHDMHGMADMHGMHDMHGMRAMMDANHDGNITAAEHAAGAQAKFDRMDSNHDGYLSKAEVEAGHKRP